MALKPPIDPPGKEWRLLLLHPRTRHGCDICMHDKPTERFIGFTGNECWICSECFAFIIAWGPDRSVASPLGVTEK